MKDEARTKKQLIDELISLRLKVPKLEEYQDKMKLKTSELRRTQERFSMLSAATNDAIHDWDIEKNQLWCNEAMQKTLGVPEIIDDPWNWWIQAMHPDDRKRMVSRMERLLKSNRELDSSEYRIQIAGGTHVYINHRLYVLRDRKGKPIRIMGSATNITERKRAEEALRESEARYRAFFETSRDSVFISSAEGRWIDLNDAAVELFGYASREELRNVDMRTLYADPGGRDKFIALMREKGYVKECPFDMKRKDGSIIHALLTSVVWKDADGNILGYQGTIRDVSEKRRIEKELKAKHAELSAAYGQLSAYDEELRQKYTELLQSQQSLHESETRYRVMFQNMGSGVAVYETRDDGRTFIFKDFNRAAETIENVKKEELIGRNVADVFPGIKEFGILDVFRRVWRTGVAEHYPISLYKDERLSSWRDNFVYKLPTEEIVAIYDDVTERKQAEEALKESEKKLKTVLEAVQAGIVVIEPETHRIVDVNPIAARMIGAARDQIVGSVCHNYICPTQVGKCPITDLGQVVDNAERVLLGADGRKYSIIKTVAPVTIKGREHLIESFIDITERKQAEEALRQSEEQYRSLVNTVDSIYIVDAGQRYLFMNEGLRKRFGMPLEQIVGKPYSDFHSKEDSDKFSEAVKTVLETGTSIQQDHKSARDGRFFIRTFSPVAGRSGEVSAVTVVSKDITDRMRAEEALKEGEQRYSTLFHYANDAIFILKGDRFIDCNAVTLEMFGCTMDQIIGSNPYAFSPPFQPDGRDSKEKALEKISRALSGELQFFEWRHTKYDGTPFDTEVSLNSVKIGDEVLTQAIVRDITQRRQAEAALRESEEKYRAIIENMEEGYIELDLTGRLTFFNDAARRFLGYSKEEILGMHYKEYADKENSDKIFKLYNEVYRTHTASSKFEWDVIRKDGTKRTVEGSASLIADAQGRPSGFRGLFRDVTDSKRAREELQKSEERYRLLAENANDIIYTIDMQTRLTYISPSVSRILGFSVEEAMGRTMKEAFTPASFELSMQKLTEEIAIESSGKHDTARSTIMQIELFHKDGSIIPFEVHYSFLRDSEGGPTGILAIARDISERKRAEVERGRLEERLQRAEKMEALGTLAGGVAHDLNNVLGVLVGYSELLLQNVPQGSPFERYAMQIFKGGQRAAAIIQDLLTLTRRGVLVSETVNLNRVISDFLQTPEFETIKSYHPGVQFKTCLDAELLNVKGSPIHLSKTVMNLLANAAEAISGSGEVLIRTENRYVDKPIHGYDTAQEGEYAVLTVSDTGSGISSADMGRIFEPFYTKKVMGRSGTGLGLAVVWGTVKDHDGYIDVESKEKKGTTFTLYFPVTRESLAEIEQAVPRSEYMGRGEHILVVDDVEGQRFLASAMLEGLGYKVDSVASGEDAIEFVRKQPVDLLILDMIMDPGIGGLETYRRILEIRKDQKAVIVSGFAITERVRRAQSLGAGSYVKKPYLLEKIGIAVRNELDK